MSELGSSQIYGDLTLTGDMKASDLNWDSVDGRLGLGVESPDSKLDIDGDIELTGNVDGVNVSSLKSDFDSHDHDGTYLNESSNLSDLTNESDARSNLGLASVASSGSHNDLSDVGGSDHHSKYTDSEAVSAVDGATLNNKLTIDKGGSDGDIFALISDNGDIDFHIGNDIDSYDFFWRYKGTDSGNDNDLELWADNAGDSNKQVYNIKQNGNINFLQTLSYGGNEVATETWVDDNYNDYTFSESHNDLSDVGSSDHHSKYTDSEAINAIESESNEVNGINFKNVECEDPQSEVNGRLYYDQKWAGTIPNHSHSSTGGYFYYNSMDNSWCGLIDTYNMKDVNAEFNKISKNGNEVVVGDSSYEIQKNGSDTSGVINFKT